MHDMEIVSDLRALLSEKLGQDRFELWLAATKIVPLDGKLLVAAPSKFSENWLRRHYRQALEEAAQQILGKAVAVEFHVDETLAAPRQPSGQEKCGARNGRAHQRPCGASGHAPDARPVSSPNCPAPAAGPMFSLVAADAAPKAVTNHAARDGSGRADTTPRRRFSTLDSFVVGACNRLAHASAQTAAERPGTLTPLVVYGPHGCGKTHLLEGIWTAARRGACANAVYLSAEQFTTLFVAALRGGGLPSFRRKYRGVELLLVDDLQFLVGKRATRVELLHTIDSLLREGRQLVFSADRQPGELSELGPELTTRLAGGMVCKLEAPDRETRLRLVREFARRLEVVLGDDVAEFIADRITAGGRELAGAVNRLHASARILASKIDRAFAETTLAESAIGMRMVRLSDIQRAVCDVFGLAKDSLQSSRRSKAVSGPRTLAMWLARKHTRAGLAEIGQFFGRRSHSTVISAEKRVSDWMAQQAEVDLSSTRLRVEEAVRRVEAQIRAG
jgi:chromosomal replication initiator protein